MPRRFLGTLVAISTVVMVCDGSAAAFSLTFDGHVLRYREKPRVTGGITVYARPLKAPTRLGVSINGRPDFVAGCRQLRPQGIADPAVLRCPFGPVPANQLHLRLSLFDGNDGAEAPIALRTSVYAGKGDDSAFAHRAYGGDGNDQIIGRRLYGGRGSDYVRGYAPVPGRNILFGGPGNDRLDAPGRLYGGLGDDQLGEYPSPSNDMMVGGPGRDAVTLGDDDVQDVVRVRGGGVDRVVCGVHPAEEVLFVDPSDHLSPSCKNAIVLLTERPSYAYP